MKSRKKKLKRQNRKLNRTIEQYRAYLREYKKLHGVDPIFSDYKIFKKRIEQLVNLKAFV